VAEGFLAGAACAAAGLKLLAAPRVRPFVIVPLLANVLLFGLAVAVGAHHLDAVMERWLPGWLEWLLWPVFALLACAVLFFGFTLIANLIAAPFNGALAEAAEAHLRGSASGGSFAWRDLPAETITALVSELRKLAYLGLRAVPLAILSFVPGVNLIAPLLWLLFGAWALVIEYADFPMGNHGLYFPEQRRLLASRRRLSLGFGTAVMLMTLIPFLNFIVVPAAVCGATRLWVQHYRDSSDRPAVDARAH
jgi:CysZ protein